MYAVERNSKYLITSYIFYLHIPILYRYSSFSNEGQKSNS
ncbi:hypothetical protein PITC_062330 [Penicillium italicum]|uniref:Uncharacterized protein n=1 Tax=Penicillium italicum TaxID=40296 RepID=A0A0A2KYZ5_PENIT|nr:hypothetical protein PITC_062330 [Penicillium italicum]